MIYHSLRIQDPHLPDLSATVLDILSHPPEHNGPAGISSVLLFDTKGFAQVIEG
ncbi:hypothetical protein [Microvirga vignae]|uniref:hypothetical protein n=1 Tax=Microvirga vignae TaxID=1225564 RepID=UPI0012379983